MYRSTPAIDGSARTLIAASLGLLLSVWAPGCDSEEGGSADPKDESAGGGIASQVAAGSQESESSEAEEISAEGVTSIPDDPAMAEKGEKLFKENGCEACHAPNKQKVGPSLAGVTERREPAWLARMIQHPDEMLDRDPTAQKLLREYGTRMANQNVSPEQTRAILAYLDTLEEQ